MDRISGLPDEILEKILSFAPTKVAASTCVLSKRWKFVWLELPKLEYVDENGKPGLLREFIHKNLPLHRARVIESLRLQLLSDTTPEDLSKWIDIALSRSLRELDISYPVEDGNVFPDAFYFCESLVVLKLRGVTLMRVPVFEACLPSLKTFVVDSVKYVDDESLSDILYICPVLEELSVDFSHDCNMTEITIIVKSLQKLSLSIPPDWSFEGYGIHVPSLKYLKLEDWNETDHYPWNTNMPELREAHVDVRSGFHDVVIGSIRTVNRLTICLEDEKYDDGIVFNNLEYLTLCVCNDQSSNLLSQLLRDSPNLRVLDICILKDHGVEEDNGMDRWKQPSEVPECMLSSLQIVNWSRYIGRPQERDIAVYILKNARHLKKAMFKVDTPELKELTLIPRASSTCELVFVEGKDM